MTDHKSHIASQQLVQRPLAWLATCCLVLLLPLAISAATNEQPAAAAAERNSEADLLATSRVKSVANFEQDIRPLLSEFCFDCHGSDFAEGDLALSELDPAMTAGSVAERWHEALNRINLGEMPPEDAAQPNDAERQMIVKWMTDSLALARQASKKSPRNLIRRLTREQYSNTLADLLRVPIEFGKNLPADPKSEMGFTNGGETLSMSSLQAEYFQSIAREALGKAIVSGERPEVKRYRATVGLNVGKDGHAASIGGYQSGPIPSDHVLVEVLDDQGNPRIGKTKKERAELKKIEKNIGIGMRGSSSDRYRMIDKGLVLFSALPHQERVPKSWQGPSPNMKMLVRRCYPRVGPFVTRVVTSQASPEDFNFMEGLTTLRSDRPLVTLSRAGGSEVTTEGDAKVLLASEHAWLKRMISKGDTLVPKDVTKSAYAGYEFELPKDGYYQVDLVHPAASGDAMPSVTIEVDDSDQHLRLDPDESPEGQFEVTPLAHAHFKKGDHKLRIGGRFFVGLSHIVFTPLADDHPVSIELSEELDKIRREAITDRSASLRGFIGTRTDDGMEYGEYDQPKVVDAVPGEWQTFEFRGQLENLPVPIYDETEKSDLSNIMLVGIWNDHLVKKHSDRGVPIIVRSIEIEAPYYPAWPPESHTQIFFDSPLRESNPDAYTHEVLKRFMRLAFRRKVTAAEVDRYHQFWQAIQGEYEDYQEGVKETLVAILCSPRFLYLANPVRQESISDTDEVALDGMALAERLSYFLWNSPPDLELQQLATRGGLQSQLVSQANRMLSDKRLERFIESFCSQWLRLDRQQAMSINVKAYPDYTRFVKRDMRLETLKFFDHVLRENMNLFTLIESDFAMLNQNLAEFYGVQGVYGTHFRPVTISPDQHRGGLLSQGAFLTGHSDGTQSHPIKRAVWLKEKILGSPPPPPPPNVPELDPETPGFEKLTLKEQLELHRNKASCVDCHRNIDPYGVVFENYDAVGRFRTEAKGRPIDSKTELPDGTQIEGVAALKSHILQHQRDDFTRSLVSHLLAYALGRDLTFADDPEIDQIVASVREQNYAMRSVILEIVQSPTFKGH